ncbi:M48 family metalloprotease [Tellurirhabdus rosea]|uniref:hypothetical protein n=1 Tax=Tellurirhabdus rosea TaxID=2674997 RepID=UPI002258602D|nr:hypothetical protein [Tellurirhabdus rosea]
MFLFQRIRFTFVKLAALQLLFAFHQAQAQGFHIICSLGGNPGYNPLYDQPPTAYAVAEINQIASHLCPMGCGSFSLVGNPFVPNAAALTLAPGVTKIAYNPVFMNNLHFTYGPAASYGVLAHEFGHHIDFFNPAAWMDHSWGRELRADAWAGCALAKAGLGIQEMSVALQAIANYPSPSHPGWQQRLPALYSGFINCGGRQQRWPQQSLPLTSR